MKLTPLLMSTVFAAGIFASNAFAQDAMKKEQPIKPADPPVKVVVDSWNDIGRKLVAMAEDFPEDKFDFKPTPAQRSFEEQLLHAAGATYYFTNALTGQKLPDGDPKPEMYKTRAALSAYVKKAFADGAAAIQAKGDKGIAELMVDPFAHQKVRVEDFAYGFIEHSGEHYGQLVVYYRLSGLVPPESRPKK